MMNNFKAIADYPGYEINDSGIVVSYKRYKEGKEKKQTITADGYMQICLNKNNKSKTLLVHRIVAETFIGKEQGKQVNHKDGNKKNNSIENLEWVSHQENMIHSYRVLKNKSPYKGKFGSKHHASKKVNVDGYVFECLREASKYIGTTQTRLRSYIKKGKPLDGHQVFYEQ